MTYDDRRTVGERLAERGMRRILVRLPAELFEAVKAEAKAKSMSQNAFVVDWLHAAVECERDMRAAEAESSN